MTPRDADGDPVAAILLAGEAHTVDEAEELYLDRHLLDVVDLVRSPSRTPSSAGIP